MSAQADFMRAMQAAGLEPDRVIADGSIHRCRAKGDKQGSRSGWYVLYLDGRAAGSFGDWRSGESHQWRADSEIAETPEDRRRAIEAMAKAKTDRDRQRAETREAAKRQAARRWQRARPASPRHPYLVEKKVQAYGLRQEGDLLLVPLRDSRGVLWSVQTISAGGEKRFPRGAAKRGLYHAIGSPIVDVVCIAEGYATAATVHAATGYPVACAFDAGNLEPVARSIRANNPQARIVICADDDRETAERIGKNPGIEAASRAAKAVDGILVTPTFDTLESSAGMPTDHEQDQRS